MQQILMCCLPDQTFNTNCPERAIQEFLLECLQVRLCCLVDHHAKAPMRVTSFCRQSEDVVGVKDTFIKHEGTCC